MAPSGNHRSFLGELKDINDLVVDRGGKWTAYIKAGNIYKRPIDKFGSASPLLVGRQQDAWILTVDPSGELLASGNPSGEIPDLADRESGGQAP